MAVLDGLVSAGVGVLSVGVSVALQVLAAGGSTVTAGMGKRHRSGGGGRSGGGAAAGAMNAVLAKLEMPRLHIALFLTGGAGLAGTGLGHLINNLSTWANSLVASWLRAWVGGGVGFLVSGAALVILLKDVKEDKAGPRTLALALAIPSLLAAIPGPVGHAAAVAVTWVVTTVAHVIGSAFSTK
ncbi:hypothetical protein OG689_44240 [Kitasatospora sp. NBC_00240]|uniref:hypothetical protein n=1 Tax=Kitasatospora sp. NBC_00240 TaxID=2903567 RepID=UPI00224C8282|nr:hypothetical protein [Kitasatospora sp. NBC_00240]MCX5216148.1 hypothetical protein [Kitasatospora sp. NBC_00240]